MLKINPNSKLIMDTPDEKKIVYHIHNFGIGAAVSLFIALLANCILIAILMSPFTQSLQIISITCILLNLFYVIYKSNKNDLSRIELSSKRIKINYPLSFFNRQKHINYSEVACAYFYYSGFPLNPPCIIIKVIENNKYKKIGFELRNPSNIIRLLNQLSKHEIKTGISSSGVDYYNLKDKLDVINTE